ncbi:hypothetical protein [Cystobacter ferrugineus]|uniref:Lipoprotein n=1 Tax=Cystobacter ferrugineus TaxID=83449 RepID=A0A1L9BDM4_9BACT|nr:hypothetical protein [Cystobacter ferrugineus]OJH40345.1 hypothetical protein BON30_15040 [Cystobacter ferrugineus]
MRFRACIALLLFVSACASAPAPLSMPRHHTFVPTRPSGPSIRLVSAPMDPVQQQSRIRKADLDQARALLFRARTDLEPRQWEALDEKLTAAERAFERFSRAAKTIGQAAEVSRGTEGVARAGRARMVAETRPRVGPLLAVLVLLYPFSTAPAEIDRRPEWVDAQREYEARLLDVAEESRRLMEEFERQEAEEVVPDVDPDSVVAVTAPTHWRKKTNPATRRNYTSVEEYDRVSRHADQTCKNSRLDELQEEKDLLNRLVPPLDPKSPGSWNEKKMAKVPCSRIQQRLEAQKKLLDKRWQIQKECFGGKPDPNHENAISEVEKAFANTRKLEDQNCAPGHPMAEL